MSFSSVIREFERRGIGNEDEIAEYIAYLLVVYHEDITIWDKLSTSDPRQLEQALRAISELDVTVHPDFPRDIPEELWREGLGQILSLLRELVPASANALGEFFQREVRFQLLRSSRGERYPTPHHICKFLAQLILSDLQFSEDRTQTLFDPTMGSAGLLVAAHQLHPDLEITGCDYNERWTHLAFVNLYLNGVRSPNIYAQSAQRFQDFDLTFSPYPKKSV